MLIKATTQYFSHKLRHIVKKNDYKQNLVRQVFPHLNTQHSHWILTTKKKKK